VTQLVRSLAPAPVFTHLLNLTDDHGLFEHAEYKNPRRDHGYCTDDVARALVVAVREPRRGPLLDQAIQTYLSFLERAVSHRGSVHNRRSTRGRWTDEPSTADCWGRAVNALGYAARLGPTEDVRNRANQAFLRAARARSGDLRASCFAAIGAAELLLLGDDATGAAQALLTDCLAVIPRRAQPGWEWPEPRLRYANAALCDALIVGGAALGHPRQVREGLSMLTALMEIETSASGHLSVTGSHGRLPGETGPLWDQQPIEVATIADACAHAFAATGDLVWRRGVELAWAWFTGTNDSATPIYDPTTGAGHDGLEPTGRNENCGAESTLAALSTLQRFRELHQVPR
jgi:hypothetical protein